MIPDRVLGTLFLLIGAVVNSVDSISIMFNIAGNAGISTNALTFYSSLMALIGGIMFDAYYWCVVNLDSDSESSGKLDTQMNHIQKVHWFVFTDIWKQKQRRKFFEIEYF